MERWQSGRMQHTANVLTPYRVRGFESHPLRRKKLPNPKGGRSPRVSGDPRGSIKKRIERKTVVTVTAVFLFSHFLFQVNPTSTLVFLLSNNRK